MVGFKLLLSIASLGASVAALHKRADSTFPLYAYGAGIGGLQVYYADGSAYIGDASKVASVVANVTFSTTSTALKDTGTLSIAAANETSISGKLLAITPSTNAMVSFTGSPSSSQTTTGFSFFGNILAYTSSSGSLLANFYASPAGEDGVYQIWWLSDPSTAATGAEPVALKREAPAEGAITKAKAKREL